MQFDETNSAAPIVTLARSFLPTGQTVGRTLLADSVDGRVTDQARSRVLDIAGTGKCVGVGTASADSRDEDTRPITGGAYSIIGIDTGLTGVRTFDDIAAGVNGIAILGNGAVDDSLVVGALGAAGRTDGNGITATHSGRAISIVCLLARPTGLQTVPIVALQTATSRSTVETMTGALGTAPLIDIITRLTRNASTGITGYAIIDTTIGTYIIDEECSVGTDTAKGVAIVILRV